jgi:hypothetical protein
MGTVGDLSRAFGVPAGVTFWLDFENLTVEATAAPAEDPPGGAPRPKLVTVRCAVDDLAPGRSHNALLEAAKSRACDLLLNELRNRGEPRDVA